MMAVSNITTLANPDVVTTIRRMVQEDESWWV